MVDAYAISLGEQQSKIRVSNDSSTRIRSLLSRKLSTFIGVGASINGGAVERVNFDRNELVTIRMQRVKLKARPLLELCRQRADYRRVLLDLSESGTTTKSPLFHKFRDVDTAPPSR